MARRKVNEVLSLPDAVVWVLLGIFFTVHVAFLLRYNTGELSQNDFVAYCNATEVATHVFALPSLVSANVEGVREVITLATVVSLIYHFMENYTTDNAVESWHRMDRATATGLIASVFLKFIVHLHHSDALIILLVGVATSVEDGGNVLAAGIVALVFLLAVLNKNTQGVLQKITTAAVQLLSLGGTTSEPEATAFTKTETNELWFALLLNAGAVSAFVFSTMNEEYDQWSHSLWHALVYTVLWRLVLVLVSMKTRTSNVTQRKARTVYETVVQPKEERWRLGTGRWR